MKKILLFIGTLGCMLTASAQFVVDYLNGANAYYRKGDYASAAEYYEKYLAGPGSKKTDAFNPYAPQKQKAKTAKKAFDPTEVKFRLAECYRNLHFPSKAAPVYKEVIETNTTAYPLTRYYYGQQLRALGQYAEAGQQFQQFLSDYQIDDAYRKNAHREVKNLAFVESEMKKKGLQYYTLSKSKNQLNTQGASYAPHWLDNNTLLFTSTRPIDTTLKNKQFVNRVYQAVYEKDTALVSLASLPQSNGQHQGAVTITPDGNTMFLTGWAVSGDKKSTAIYSAQKNGTGWSNPVVVSGSVNASGSNNEQPHVSADGQYLYFSSNRAGGQGGYDIWAAPLSGGQPGEPQNLGSVVNTADDEQAPFYHAASGSLIFSTNGRVGMGGFDFFQSKGTVGQWSEPVNLGYPVNSVKDDIYMYTRGTAKNILSDVILSSDRDAVCCLELFDLQRRVPARTITGALVSCKDQSPVSGATIEILDAATNSLITTKQTNTAGQYQVTLQDPRPLKAIAKLNGYADTVSILAVPTEMEIDQLEFSAPSFCIRPLFPPPIGTVEEIPNILYDFNKATLQSASFPVLDKLAANLLANPGVVLEIRSHTDAVGPAAYNQNLSDHRAQSVVDYLIGKGVKAEQLQATGYGETLPIEPNRINGKDNPAGRAKNRRTEFKVLQDK
ncbi:MAG: OmpA family protein [Bacteroidota bacterium]